MWDSFNPILDTIRTALEEAEDLRTYAGAHFGGAFKVSRIAKRRNQVGEQDLPIVMITSPDRDDPDSKASPYPMHNRIRTVRIYYGFMCREVEEAQAHLVRVDELIEETLLRAEAVKQAVHRISSGPGRNDEGFYHPFYFGVSDFEAWQRVS